MIRSIAFSSTFRNPVGAEREIDGCRLHLFRVERLHHHLAPAAMSCCRVSLETITRRVPRDYPPLSSAPSTDPAATPLRSAAEFFDRSVAVRDRYRRSTSAVITGPSRGNRGSAAYLGRDGGNLRGGARVPVGAIIRAVDRRYPQPSTSIYSTGTWNRKRGGAIGLIQTAPGRVPAYKRINPKAVELVHMRLGTPRASCTTPGW